MLSARYKTLKYSGSVPSPSSFVSVLIKYMRNDGCKLKGKAWQSDEVVMVVWELALYI